MYVFTRDHALTFVWHYIWAHACMGQLPNSVPWKTKGLEEQQLYIASVATWYIQ